MAIESNARVWICITVIRKRKTRAPYPLLYSDPYDNDEWASVSLPVQKVYSARSLTESVVGTC
jgi:hypothetical protein